MTQEMIQSFMLKNGECFDMAVIPDIQRKLEEVDDSKASMILSVSFQKPTVILIIAIVLGWERFFINDIVLGILKIVTCYGCGIWWLVDIFTAQKRTYEYNYKKFLETLLYCR